MASPDTMLEDRDWLRQWWTVHHHPTLHGLIVEDFALPEGWAPDTVDLLMRYLTAGPLHHARLYLPSDTRYTQGEAKHFTNTEVGDGTREWRWYCIHWFIDDPARIDIEDVLRVFMASLNHPEKDLPIVFVDEATPDRITEDDAVSNRLPF